MINRYLALLLILTKAPVLYAYGGFEADQAQVKGSVIAEIGEAKELPPPSGSKWKEQPYVLNSRCFTIFGYYGYWGYGGKPAMLLVKQDRSIILALFEFALGSPSIKTYPVLMAECPENANIPPSCDGLSPEECQKRFDEHIKKLVQELKRLKGEQ